MRLGILIGIIILLWSCGRKSERSGNSFAILKDNPNLSPDFMQFYMQFHTDSVYQVEHTLFPLSGLPANADSLTLAKGNYQWEAKTWRMHRPFNSNGEKFQQNYSSVNEDTVIEYITDKETSYGMERRFSRLSGDWYLIYYAGMNLIQQ